MDLWLCVFSTILFSAAFQTLNDTASSILTNKGYSSSQISLVILARVIGKVAVGFAFRKFIKRMGVFRFVVSTMIVFCESVCIFWFVDSIYYIAILNFITSGIFNFIILHMNSAIRNYGNGKLLVTYYSISQILSALAFPFDVFEKILVIVAIGLLSLGCFIARDLNKSQVDTNEKGEGAILKAYFKYGKYFWSSLIYSISHWLVNKYLLLSLVSVGIENKQIAKIMVLLALGRLFLNYLLSKLVSEFHPRTKIIFSSIWTIVNVALLNYTMYLESNIFLIFVFFAGVFLNSKVFMIEYFTKIKKPEDYNVSVQLTEQQIDSLSQFFVIILASALSFLNVSYGIFVSLIALHVIVILTIVF